MTLLEAAKQALEALENVWSNGVEELTTAPMEALRQAIEQADKQEWVGLTDEEMFDALKSIDSMTVRLPSGFVDFANAIEAKLKEKNT